MPQRASADARRGPEPPDTPIRAKTGTRGYFFGVSWTARGLQRTRAMKTELALLSFSAFVAFGCSSTTAAAGLSSDGSRNAGIGGPPGSSSSEGGSSSGGEPTPAPGSGGVQAGQLTAGVWD